MFTRKLMFIRIFRKKLEDTENQEVHSIKCIHHQTIRVIDEFKKNIYLAIWLC